MDETDATRCLMSSCLVLPGRAHRVIDRALLTASLESRSSSSFQTTSSWELEVKLRRPPVLMLYKE